jgi:hypothetical protein
MRMRSATTRCTCRDCPVIPFLDRLLRWLRGPVKRSQCCHTDRSRCAGGIQCAKVPGLGRKSGVRGDSLGGSRPRLATTNTHVNALAAVPRPCRYKWGRARPERSLPVKTGRHWFSSCRVPKASRRARGTRSGSYPCGGPGAPRPIGIRSHRAPPRECGIWHGSAAGPVSRETWPDLSPSSLHTIKSASAILRDDFAAAVSLM